MYPEINLGPLALQTFGLMFALAFIGSGWLFGKRMAEYGKPFDWAYEAAFAALLGGIVGARAYWLIDNWSEVDGDVLGNLFSGSGLTWYGGLAGGAIGVLLWAWWRDFLNLRLADAAAPALLLGHAIGRIGCQLSGDGDYGKPWDGPWAMGYPDGTVPTPPGVEVHPTPVYETLVMGFGAWLLWRLRDRFRPGILFAIWLIYAGAERFLIEFLRVNTRVALGLSTAQFIALGLIAVGIGWILVVRNRYGTLAPPETAPAAPAGKTGNPAKQS